MIITILLSIILMILNLVVSFIPTIEFDINMATYIFPLANFVGYIDTFVSINVLITCISLILIVDNYSLIFRVFNWLWQKIPFIN